ncbi:MAG: DHH family phosphoesterase [Eubacteriales bacterium]|nr:DHH family phosphoesterase [Eubacteriales bacterium]
MKKRIWTAMPVYLIFALVMLLMATATYLYNKILCLVEVGVSLIALAVVLVLIIRFRIYVRKVVASATQSAAGISEGYLESLKLPTALLGEYGEILIYNKQFKRLFFKNAEAVNENIASYIKDETLESMCMNERGVDTTFMDKKLTVYTHKVDKGYMVSVVDNTYFKNIEREFYNTQKSVALVVFDNIDDFNSSSEEDGTQAMIMVENLLSRWSSKHHCLYRKLADSKYLIIFDEKVLLTQIDKRFRILDKVRQIKIGERAATVSIGIGRNCSNLYDSHLNAKKAIDMALGRGGDQVAILSDGEYEFYGGVSKGVEKTSKVRVRVIAESVKNAISQCDKVLIMGHKYSDLDCVGAAAGMYSVVTKTFSKRAYVVCDVEKSMAKSLIERLQTQHDDMFINIDRAMSIANEKTLLFIVDTHSPDFIESPKVHKLCGKVIVIDHHRKMVNYIDDSDVFFHEPTASSTSEMVTELIGYLGDDGLSKLEAEGLLSGIMLDTKNFVINTGVRTFEAAAHLRKKGADSIDTYREKYKLVSKAQIVNNCAISTIDGIVKNSRLLSAQAADEMLTISDVYASFVISRIDSKNVNISARSYGKINVQVIMEKLGGGGHQNMAAAQLADISVEEAKEKLIATIRLI